jgi:hypothetical protein
MVNEACLVNVRCDRDLVCRVGWKLQVSIKIYPACCPFNRIDRAIVILVEFLKMVIQNIANMRVETSSFGMVFAWGIPLGTLQNPLIGKVGFRFDRCLGPMLLIVLHPTIGWAHCPIRWLLSRFRCKILSHALARLNPRLNA